MSPKVSSRVARACTFLLLMIGNIAMAQNPEYRGMWVDAWKTELHSASGITAVINQMRAANMNSVVAQVRRRGDALYISNYEPKIAQLANSSFDPLADLIAKAHNTNAGPRLDVHAWIVTYPIWSGSSNSVATNHPLYLHPDWLNRSNSVNGPTYTGSGYVFDPGHPEVQKHTFNVAMDIISRYDIDALGFDYVRYPEYGASAGFQPWGYNPVSIARFNKLYGRTGEPDATDPEFAQFRRDQVTALVRKVYLSAIAIKPHMKIVADTITWNPSPADITSWTNGANAYRTVMQDWRAWMEEGILDINRPMNYYRDGVHPADYRRWLNFTVDHKYNRHAAIGPGVYLNFDTNVIAQMRATRLPSPNGNFADGVFGYSYQVPVTNTAATTPTMMYQAFAQPGVTNRNGVLIDPDPVPMFNTHVPVPDMPWKSAPTRGHLKGFLYAANMTNVVDGGTVAISGPVSRSLTTDATGFFGAVDLLPGNYTATVSIPDYTSYSTNFTVAVGQVQHIDILVHPRTVTITQHPTPQVVIAGTNVSFSVEAIGEAPFTYQWRFNGVNIPGATNSVYNKAEVQFEDEGNYSVLVSNALDQEESQNAYLRVAFPVRPTGTEELWRVEAGSGSYITTNSTERGLAYNPATGNLILVTRAGGAKILVLNSDTGAAIRQLNSDTNIVNGGFGDFTLQVGSVADDGAIYACNLVLSGAGFKIYRWENDSNEAVPVVAFSGNPFPNTSLRWGDSIDVRGAGTNTQIIVGARTGNNFCILTTSDGTNFVSNNLTVSGVTGTIGLAFGRGNTFWNKNISQPLHEITFDLATSTASIVNTISTEAVPSTVSGIAVHPVRDLIAGVAMQSPDHFYLYDGVHLPPSLVDSVALTDLPNVNNTAALDFGTDRVFALDSNNGLVALRLRPRYPVRLESIQRVSGGKLGVQTDSDPVAQTVQSTSDFIQWESLTNVVPTNGYFEVIEPNTNSAHKFFRTKIP